MPSSFLVHCAGVNLYAPWEVPIAIASESQPVLVSLYYYAMSVSVFYYLLCDRDVLFERLRRHIDHYGCESSVDAALAEFERITVVKVKNDRDLRVLNDGSLYELYQIGVVRVGSGALGYLQDYRAAEFSGCLGDALYDLHVVYIECSDGVSAVISFFEHFC